ncbi:unnamed protein product [Adineta ricciae]|uniref:Nuclear receptor domain-containing protein n=1 Tax=Adineta ricciae TaxID=249248 RepID=A0A815R7Y6_ADIRI|nr:unnamed protein product [Adineta ricciae]CAF1472989.1 unnamed protein product [Adineta ricciae]
MTSLSSLCQVCGDLAKRNQSSIISCLSCRSFFRKYSSLSRNILYCQNNWNCRITSITRMKCAACRLKKCFLIGMNMNLNNYNNRYVVSSSNQQPFLYNEQLKFTTEQWYVFSNFISIDNNVNSINSIEYLLEHQFSLPIKLRFKSTIIFNIIRIFLQNNQLILKRLSHYQLLSVISYRMLFKRNCLSIAMFHGFVVAHQLKIEEHDILQAALVQICGSTWINKVKSIYRQFESNVIFIKLMIFVLNFSTNLSVVTFDEKEDLKQMIYTRQFIPIQDIYVTILWKYMIYRCGFYEAIKQYDKLVKNIIDILYNNHEKLDEDDLYSWTSNAFLRHIEHSLII